MNHTAILASHTLTVASGSGLSDFGSGDLSILLELLALGHHHHAVQMLRQPGVKVQGTNYEVQGTSYKLQATRYKVQATRYKVHGTRYKVHFWPIFRPF